MATHSSVLAWRIPGTGEPGGLPSMGSHRVGYARSDLAAAAAYLMGIFPLHFLLPWSGCDVPPLPLLSVAVAIPFQRVTSEGLVSSQLLLFFFYLKTGMLPHINHFVPRSLPFTTTEKKIAIRGSNTFLYYKVCDPEHNWSYCKCMDPDPPVHWLGNS